MIEKIDNISVDDNALYTFRRRGNESLKWMSCTSKDDGLSSGRRSTSARRIGKSKENPLWATRTG